MKTTGTIEGGDGLWYAPNIDATNESGWSGLPGGYRISNGEFVGIGNLDYWWSSKEDDVTTFIWIRFLGNFGGFIGRDYGDKKGGFPVRCLRD
jgi:uncharacterized protein (TIGR02145 family)